MKCHRPRFHGIESLERRTVLSASSEAFLPYSLLTIPGHFQATASTTVTFKSDGRSIAVTPSEVTSKGVTVAIPGFFNAKTGASTLAKADVFVAQVLASGKARSVRALHNFPIASLPQTGLPVGAILERATIDGVILLDDATAGFSSPPPTLFGIDTAGVSEELRALQTVVFSLIPGGPNFSMLTSVELGTYQGKPVVLDASTAALAERAIAALVDDPSGYRPHAKPVLGLDLATRLDGLVYSAVSQGSPGLLQMSTRFLDILSTIPGTKELSPGATLTGLLVADTVALVAVADAEAGTASRRTTPADPSQVDQFLSSPAIPPGYELILNDFVPNPQVAQSSAVLDIAAADQALATKLRFTPAT
jgi:hypothetical protein